MNLGRRDTMKLIALAGCLAAGSAAIARAGGSLVFEKDVLPIFESRCAACHFPDADELKGKLDLSTYAKALAGGAKGQGIIPGKADESPLVQMIDGKSDTPMPPKQFKRLKPDEIELIKRWINEGAKSAGGEAAAPVAERAPAANAKKVAAKGFFEAEIASVAKPSGDPKSEAAKKFFEAEAGLVSQNHGHDARATFDPISAFAYSPKGDLLARGGLHKVDLFSVDPETGKTKPLATLEGHAELVRGLAFSPDGAMLAAAGGKPGRAGEIKIWNVADRSPARTISGHKDNIFAVAFSPDGKQLASCSYDKMVKLWNPATGEEIANLKDHIDAVYAVAFSPDGKTLASASGDRTIKVWEAATGKRMLTLSDSLGPVYAVSFSPDGRRLAGTGADKMVRIWDVADSLKTFTQTSLTGATQIKSSFAHDAAVLRVIFAPDGKTIYTTGEDKRIKAWDAESLLSRMALEAQPDWVMALALSPDGKRIAAGRYDASSAIYDTATGEAVESAGAMVANSDQDHDQDQDQEPKAGGRKKIKSLDVDNVVINALLPASIQSVSPRYVTRGQTVTFDVRGTNLDEPELLLANPKFKAKILENEEKPVPELNRPPGSTGAFIVDNGRPFKMKLEVEIAADAPLGDQYPMFRTKWGITNGGMFTVLPRADLGEKEPNNARGEAQAIESLPATVAASIGGAGDADLYKIVAKAGDEIVVALSDSGIESPVMRALDAEGKTLAASRDFPSDGRNLRVGFRAEKDGDYFIELADESLGAGGYRLHAGPFPYVYDASPLGVAAGPPVKIKVKGFNIGGATEMEVDPPDEARDAQEIGLPLPGYEGNPVGAPSISVAKSGEAFEAEPNNDPASAQTLAFPGAAYGVIAAGDSDLYRISAQKGQFMIIETVGARVGSPLDSVIEILDASGKPLERATVRCVAETYMTLSDRDSSSAGIRIDNWTDFKINDYAMVGSEIIRVRRLPGYADEDMSFHAWPGGQRRGYIGTTPEHHAVNTKVYKAEVHPPASKFPPNGLPTYRIDWRNDDAYFEGKRPGDSALEFTAPADGDYLIRVADANGSGGDRHAYQLLLRSPQPDFEFGVGPYWPNVPEGGAIPIDVRIRRIDGFNEPVEVAFEGLPEGFSVNGDVVIPDSENLTLSLRAARGAKSTPYGSTFKATARAKVGGKEVVKEARIGDLTVRRDPDLRVNLDVPAIAIPPGGSGSVGVTLDRFNGFTSRVPLAVLNLPFGVQVMNTGLNGILVREGEHDRRIEISVEPWVAPMKRRIYVQATIESRSSSPVFLGQAIDLTIGDEKLSPTGNVASKESGLSPEQFLNAIR